MQETRGRPRDESIELKIHHAVVELLIERGYTGTTIEQVAKRTGIGRPTIYRRYSSRSAMINEVVKTILNESLDALVENADPYINVQNHLVNTVDMLTTTAIGPIYRAVIAEIPLDSALSDIVGQVGQVRRQRLRKAVNRALRAHAIEIKGAVDTFIDGMIGAIYFRYLMAPEALTSRYARELLKPHKL